MQSVDDDLQSRGRSRGRTNRSTSDTVYSTVASFWLPKASNNKSCFEKVSGAISGPILELSESMFGAILVSFCVSDDDLGTVLPRHYFVSSGGYELKNQFKQPLVFSILYTERWEIPSTVLYAMIGPVSKGHEAPARLTNAR